MSEEIKIILNIIKKASKREANSYNALIQTDSKKYKQLLDYITNLQQENKQLKEDKRKAIEYIKEHIKYECDIAFNGMQFYSHRLYDFSKKELLEILGDKENEHI